MKSQNTLEKVVSAPAQVLDGTIETTQKFKKEIIDNGPVKKAREYWDLLGPGLTTGASDDDPSGIATYSQTGARYGFSFLWTAVLTFPMMAVVQEMCARIGMVTGRGLAGNIRVFFPRYVLYFCTALLFGANVLNIGANLGAMAKGVQLILPTLPFAYLVVFFALSSILSQIYVSYQNYAKYLKWLALVLLSYVFSTLLADGINWREVSASLLDIKISFDKDQILMLCAILGTTISPYLFFWQTSQEVEEAIEQGGSSIQKRRQSIDAQAIKNMRIDVWSGMFLSNLVMFFIIVACAATLNKAGIYQINSAADAARALRPLAGDWSYFLFAIGIIGTGLLSIPVLSGSLSYAISESFMWKGGLHYKVKQASAFYGIIVIAMILGLVLNFVGLDPIRALIYSAIANGLIAPIILFLIVIIGSNKKVMKEYVNSKTSMISGYAISSLMAVASILTIIYLLNP